MIKRHRFTLACCLLLSSASCRQKAVPVEKPLLAEELPQFDQPLLYAAWNQEGSWPQFCHDPLHSGRSDVDLGSAEMELAWRFRPTTRAWTYQPGFAVWSSPASGTIAGRPLVVLGSQDRNVYAVDARTGEKAWEFRPGAPVFAAPALGVVGGRAMVFAASLNRSIYGLDAVDGSRIWQCETASWSFTAARSVMASPTVVVDNRGEVLLLAGVWNADRSATQNVQSGECLAISAGNGEVQWRRRLGSVPVSSPAFARVHGVETVFVACGDGTVHALALADGAVLWTAVLNEESHSSPSIGLVEGLAQVCIGSRLNSVFGLSASSGARRWRAETGYWVDATPAWLKEPSDGGPRAAVVAGSYDRSVYKWDAHDGTLQWQVLTGNYAYSSCALARIGQTPVVLAMSWDEHLYLFEAGRGQMLWRYQGGPLLWSHAYMGDSLWASPAVIKAEGRPMLLFPAFDGVLYAFRPIQPTAASRSADPRH